MDKDEGQSNANIIMVTDGPAIPNPRERRLINAWSIALTGAVLSLLLLCYMGPSSYREALLFLPDGILLTFKLTALAICCAVPPSSSVISSPAKLSVRRIAPASSS